MPQIGEVKKAREIGYKSKRCSYIWSACVDCGKERWIQLYPGRQLRCLSCAAIKRQLKDGRINKDGYHLIKLYPNDFFYPMAQCDGYVFEHRLVMAKHLGRCLHKWELVHHKRGIAKSDNRIEGLQLVSEDKHNQITIMERRITFLEARVTLLEAENVVLKANGVYDYGR